MRILKLLIVCLFYVNKINTQTTTQTCKCVIQSSCYENIAISTNPSDGSGIIDPRIVNGGGTVTVPPVTQPPATITCSAGTEPCCTPNSGCGVRYNIPLTAATTPAGDQARYGSQPWQALILTMDNFTLGSGVLIDNNNILTAAHKLVGRVESGIKIRLGDWNRVTDVETYKVQEFTVKSIFRHPNFTANNLYNDVAIIRLSTPVVIGSNPAINTACLPNAAPPTIFDGLRCFVTGWGKNAFNGAMQTVVKEVYVPIVNNAVCETQLRTTKLKNGFVLNTNSFICAGGEVGRDACVDDGGSPLMCNIGGKYQVAGLVAWGIDCGSASVPGVYVRVQSFLPWINQMRTA